MDHTMTDARQSAIVRRALETYRDSGAEGTVTFPHVFVSINTAGMWTLQTWAPMTPAYRAKDLDDAVAHITQEHSQ